MTTDILTPPVGTVPRADYDDNGRWPVILVTGEINGDVKDTNVFTTTRHTWR